MTKIVYHRATKAIIVKGISDSALIETHHAIVTALEAAGLDLEERDADGAPAGQWVADEWVVAGSLRMHSGQLYECLQTHRTQADWAPPIVPALWLLVPHDQPAEGEWGPGQTVAIGDELDYDGVTYRCRQAHKTQLGWEPNVVPALWEVVAAGGSEWAAGVAYAVDDEVTYQSATYRCLQAHTAIVGWEPPNVPALWLAL